MRVRSLARKLTTEAAVRIGGTIALRTDVPVNVEYLVFGLSLAFGSKMLGTGLWCQIEDVGGNLVLAPLDLFEIIDSRASGLWEFKKTGDGLFELQPPEFFAPHFGEDVSNGVATARAQVAHVRARLEREHATQPTPP